MLTSKIYQIIIYKAYMFCALITYGKLIIHNANVLINSNYLLRCLLQALILYIQVTKKSGCFVVNILIFLNFSLFLNRLPNYIIVNITLPISPEEIFALLILLASVFVTSTSILLTPSFT